MKDNIYFNAWKQSFDFKGTTGRKDYWLFFLINFIISLILGSIAGILENLYLLASVFPWFAITCRRLNDVGKSRWWCFPGFLWTFILYLCFFLPMTYRVGLSLLIGVLGVLISPTIIVLFIYTLRKSSIKNTTEEGKTE